MKFILLLISIHSLNALPTKSNKKYAQYPVEDTNEALEIETDLVENINDFYLNGYNDKHATKVKRDVWFNTNTNVLTTTTQPAVRNNKNNNAVKSVSAGNNIVINPARGNDKHFNNNFINAERNANKHLVNNSTGQVNKVYICRLNSNRNDTQKSGYDAMYYRFVKDLATNKYVIKNSTVIHGYYNDVNNKPVANNAQIVNTVNNPGIGNNNNNQLPENNKLVDNNNPIDDVIVKKSKTEDCNVITNNTCPDGFVKDPSGTLCVPDYSTIQSDDYYDA